MGNRKAALWGTVHVFFSARLFWLCFARICSLVPGPIHTSILYVFVYFLDKFPLVVEYLPFFSTLLLLPCTERPNMRAIKCRCACIWKFILLWFFFLLLLSFIRIGRIIRCRRWFALMVFLSLMNSMIRTTWQRCARTDLLIMTLALAFYKVARTN